MIDTAPIEPSGSITTTTVPAEINADTDGDGIGFWANNDGSGFIRLLKLGGGYSKTLEPDFGTSINFSFTVNHQLSVPKQIVDNEISCYPNPTNNIVYLDGEGLGESVVSIYNSLGQMVAVPIASSSNNVTLNFSGFPKGMYSIAVNTNGKLYNKKVIVQ